MKIFNINPFLNFKGQRQDRKTVVQLKQENPYDLNVMNQRRISQAITNLSEVEGEDNIEFLLDVSENLKYGTNIDLGKASYNEWQVKLNNAVKKSLSKSPQQIQEKYAQRLIQAQKRKSLTDNEKEILKIKDEILSQIDPNELEEIHSNNIKNFKSNLEYFIISSEVPIGQKLYIMKKLAYFMSPEYKINSQLEGKKTQALAEIVNDIVIDTPESKIPNIKSINQRQHGMCAAISICRKALAYEDKANFVDMVISELDDNPQMMVYDITKLGSHTKIPMPKTALDFNYAMSRGYRIIDTSALYWMNIADTDMADNEKTGTFYTFDKDFFDTFHDSHLLPDLDDSEMAQNQDFYRALLKAKEAVERCKKERLIDKYKSEKPNNKIKNAKESQEYYNLLKTVLQEISPDLDNKKARQIINDLIRLEIKDSEKAQKIDDYKKDFVYLPNESKEAKEEKINAFLSLSLEKKDSLALKEKSSQILDYITSINELSSGKTSTYTALQIRHAQDLYNAAAAYRTQVQFRMEIPEELNYLLINSDIPDRETLISDNMDQLIAILEKEIEAKAQGKKLNPKNRLSNEIKEGLAFNFQAKNDPEILIEAIKENQKTLKYMMTDMLDDFYKAALCGSRRELLANEINILKNNIKENDIETIITLAKNLKTEQNTKEILEILDGYTEILISEDCTEDDYIGIYNSIGKKNQMQDFADTYTKLSNALFIDRDENIIKAFNLINGLNEDAPIEETQETFLRLGQHFNNMSIMTTTLQNALEIRTSDGEILNTVINKEILMKQLENMGEIISVRDLRALQNRFNEISRLRTEDNGESIKLKDLPKELTTFSKHEKEVLNHIEQNINRWHKQTTRALNLQYRKIQDPLSELNRKVGVKTGQHWIGTEGKSGLFDAQQIKIFEHMTDRPYYSESNTKLALQKIKNGPYSGISGSSVDDKSPAYHAQYIVDIRPVQVKLQNGETAIKEAVFHDNTWGPSEHENLWIDRSGLLRTDYSRGYGGDLGYITDEKYRTGKLVDNLLGQVGILKPEIIDSKAYKKLAGRRGEEIKFPMFDGVITPGKNPSTSSYVRMIRDNSLISSILFFSDMENMARRMTQGQIKALIKKTENIGENIYHDYQELDKRIDGTPPFDKGIKTKSDYEKLPDNDPLKILFEKIALIKSYSDIPDSKIFYHNYTMDELKVLKTQIRKEAIKNFNYTFGKNKDIANYGAERSRKMLNNVLTHFAQEHNIKLTPIQKVKIINSLKHISANEFDGSLDTTTRLMSESFEKYMLKHTPDFIDKEAAINNLAQDVRNYLKTNMTFTIDDMNSPEFNSAKIQNVTKWIDKNFDPKTDEEFVEIFKKLQNMTTKEFNKKYSSIITDEAIGFKPITGYDVLTLYRGLDERTQNSVFNMLYYQKLGYDINLSETKPEYEYGKFEKVLRGSIYEKGQRTFDDLYFDYYYSLFSLTLQDRYKNMRGEVFNKYKVFPAYPTLEIENQDALARIIQTLYQDLDNSIDAIKDFKSQERSITIIKELHNILSKFKNSQTLKDDDRKYIKELLAEFISINGEDDSIKNTLNAAYNIMDLADNARAKEYKEQIAIMKSEMDLYSATPDGKTMKDSIKAELEKMNTYKREFILNTFAPKYQAKANKILNKYINTKMKNSPDAKRIFEEDFTLLFDEHRISKTPQKLLNEYLLLIAKPEEGKINKASKEYISKLETKIQKLENSGTNEEELEKLKKELNLLKEKELIISTYSGHVKSLLDCANTLDLEYILMDCAKEANLNIVRQEFKNSTIRLRNGQTVKMDSNEAVNMIFMPLIIGDNIELTLKLTNQLGMNEEVARMIIKSTKLDNVRKSIKRIDNIYTALSKQTTEVENEIKKLGYFDDNPNYREKLEILKINLMKKFEHTNYSKTKHLIKQSIDKTIEDIEKNPNHSKSALLFVNMEMAKEASLYLAANEVEKINNQLMNFQHIANFARKLNLPKESSAYAELQDYIKKLNELEDYAKAHTRRYENIGMTTTASDTID